MSFSPDDIVRAIEAVQKTGLTVYGVEITADGSIKVSTTSPFRRGATKHETIVDAEEHVVQPKKKRA